MHVYAVKSHGYYLGCYAVVIATDPQDAIRTFNESEERAAHHGCIREALSGDWELIAAFPKGSVPAMGSPVHILFTGDY